MNKKIYYNQESIETLKKEITRYGNDLINSFNRLSNALDEMDEIYNSPSGVLFKEKFKEYIDNKIKYINDNYLPYATVIDDIILTFDDANEKIEDMVGEN